MTPAESMIGSEDDDATLIPEHGGRVRIERVDAGGDGVRARVALATPDGVTRGEATVRDGVVVLDVRGAPEWLESWARALLVTLAKRAGEGEAWPRVVVRWRERK